MVLPTLEKRVRGVEVVPKVGVTVVASGIRGIVVFKRKVPSLMIRWGMKASVRRGKRYLLGLVGKGIVVFVCLASRDCCRLVFLRFGTTGNHHSS